MSPQNKTRSKSPKSKSPKRKTRKSRVSYGFNQPLQRENRRMSRKHTKKSNQPQKYEMLNGIQRIANTYHNRKESSARQLEQNYMKQYENAEPILKKVEIGRAHV